MLGALKNRIPFLQSADDFLIVDIDLFKLQILRVILPKDSRRFEIISEISCKIEDINSAFIELSKLIKIIRPTYKTKIILSLSHRYISTFREPVTLMRSDSKMPITETELENLISQGLWKIFNKFRHSCALKMRVEDIAVKVADSDVLAVRLDNHKIADAIGFTAKEVELYCQQTLIVQSVSQAIQNLLPEEQIVSIQEGRLAWPLLAVEADKSEQYLFLNVLASETILYIYSNQSLHYLDTLVWGSNDIVRAVAQMFNVDSDSAIKIIEKYHQEKISTDVLRRVEEAISAELSILLKGIEAHRLARKNSPVRSGGEIGKIFISSEFKLREELLGLRLRRKLDLKFVPTLFSKEWISEKFGYALKLKNNEKNSNDYDWVLASLVASVSMNNQSAVSKIAKRRARWM